MIGFLLFLLQPRARISTLQSPTMCNLSPLKKSLKKSLKKVAKKVAKMKKKSQFSHGTCEPPYETPTSLLLWYSLTLVDGTLFAPGA